MNCNCNNVYLLDMYHVRIYNDLDYSVKFYVSTMEKKLIERSNTIQPGGTVEFYTGPRENFTGEGYVHLSMYNDLTREVCTLYNVDTVLTTDYLASDFLRGTCKIIS